MTILPAVFTDLTPSAIAAACDRAGIAAPVFRTFDQIGSTNDAAAEWLRTAAPPAGSFVTTHDQVGGRGRLGRVWQTTPGAALTVSVIAYPAAASVGRLPLAGALAVVETLAGFGISAGIKWPNDVLVNERKVCGVLPEAQWDGDRLIGAVLGIGINVREDFTGTPLAATAGSLTPLTGIALDRADLLARLIGRITHWLPRLDDPALFAAWRARLLLIGQRVRVTHAASADTAAPVEGRALAVDADGALRLELADGMIQRVLAGDIMPTEPGGA